jgi:hypothetical protein
MNYETTRTLVLSRMHAIEIIVKKTNLFARENGFFSWKLPKILNNDFIGLLATNKMK